MICLSLHSVPNLQGTYLLAVAARFVVVGGRGSPTFFSVCESTIFSPNTCTLLEGVTDTLIRFCSFAFSSTFRTPASVATFRLAGAVGVAGALGPRFPFAVFALASLLVGLFWARAALEAPLRLLLRDSCM